MKSTLCKISTLTEYEKFQRKDFQGYSKINPEIFNLAWVDHLTYNAAAGTPQWKITYYTSEGILHQITEKQLVQFILRYQSYQFDRASLGLRDWYGNTVTTLQKSNNLNYYAMTKRFIPKDSELVYLRKIDPFFLNVVKQTSSWLKDSHNFDNSVKTKEILRITPVDHFTKEKPGFDEIPQETLAQINFECYAEARKQYGRTATAVDRSIISEKAAKAFLKRTGYRYDHTEYDINTAWFDEHTLELTYLIKEDFWKALELMSKEMLPGTTSGLIKMLDENLNPIACTPEYVNQAKESFEDFCKQFHLTEKYTEGIDEEDYVEKIIAPVVEEINSQRDRFECDDDDNVFLKQVVAEDSDDAVDEDEDSIRPDILKGLEELKKRVAAEREKERANKVNDDDDDDEDFFSIKGRRPYHGESDGHGGFYYYTEMPWDDDSCYRDSASCTSYDLDDGDDEPTISIPIIASEEPKYNKKVKDVAEAIYMYYISRREHIAVLEERLNNIAD